MIQTCQNCKKEFQIAEEDLQFYERINVPPPTWCPECRLQRRMVFMNQRVLYKRNCDLCNKEFLSAYPKDFKGKVYCIDCWWNKLDPMDYGRDYDFSKPFFEQLKDLFEDVPRLGFNRLEPTIINSDYCNICSELKNSYLLFNSDYSEECGYGTFVENSKNSFDLYMVDKLELCYECIGVRNSYKTFYSVECRECMDVWFSYNLSNCKHCIGCANLKNKEYCIFNKQYSKEDYFKELEKMDFGSYKTTSSLKAKFFEFLKTIPYKFISGKQNYNVSGDYIYNSKNALNAYEVVSTEDSKYVSFLTIPQTKNSYDFTMWGGGAENMYECMGCGGGQYNVKFSYSCWLEAYNLNYCYEFQGGSGSSSNLFGCVGLRNKEYCILNKQYTKEEYESLVPKIIKHMNDMPYIDKKGRIYKYGEFFPSELSPFCYNETIAQEYFPKTKEQAISEGYNWKEPEEKNIIPDIKTEDLPDNIKDVDESIIGKIIQCEHSKIKEDGTLEPTCNEMCTRGFKIIKQELDFYKRMNLPIPRLCPNCRHFQRLKQRNPLKLWHRKCQCQGTYGQNPNNPNIYQNQTTHFHQNNPCPNEFETSYPPDRPEIVYCEECYNQEVV